jgi:hypothetical protein
LAEDMGGGLLACVPVQMGVVSSALVDEGYQLSVEPLLILLFPYQCATFLLLRVGQQLAFW